MNRRDFFTILIKELKSIEPSELQDVLQYYNEYFDDAGSENEQSVIDELGSPQKIAAAIRATSTIKYCEQSGQTPKKSFKALWITLGTIFAAPIALPIAATLAMVFISLIIVYASLLFSFFAVAISLIIVGIPLVGIAFFLIPSGLPVFLFFLGSGLAVLGLGIMAFVGSLALSQISFKGIMLLINRGILRRTKSNV